ncbi:arrestin domain-containing protein 3-like [Chanos chanos]|uniref:Arrestin domain-containing protein 3-like n=1 Tax=Chanos chanos TaxID=29144 RepID=A0A6J2UJZ7_CHACN|nr:arrestin domain-containing protein 3-like [Chanos chanos]
MPGTIRDFSLHYDSINEANTFSGGDYVRGRVILEVTRQIKVEMLVVQIKGEADEMVELLVEKHTQKLLFGETDKKMKLFTSGNASMKVNIEKMGFIQGEMLKVIAAVENSSSRPLKLKYSLQQRQKFFDSRSKSKSVHNVIFKAVGDLVPSGHKQTVIAELHLPAHLQLSIFYCNIIKVEYFLKVYLDVPYASDPEVILPLVILPPGQPSGPLSTPSGGPFGNPAQPGWNGPPTHNAAGPYPSASASGVYPPPTAPGPNQHQCPPAVHPQSANPGAPPPMYSELYLTPSAPVLYPNLPPFSAPGFCPAPSAPGQYPNPNVSGSLTVPTASDCNPPPYTATAHPVPSAPGYCPDTTTPGPCPAKMPL